MNRLLRLVSRHELGRILSFDRLQVSGAEQVDLAQTCRGGLRARAKHGEQARGRPKWAASAKSRWRILHRPYLLPSSAQLLGFCLFSILEIIVGLHEEKPSTLPIADRTRLL